MALAAMLKDLVGPTRNPGTLAFVVWVLPEDYCKKEPLQFQHGNVRVKSWPTHVQLLVNF